MNNKLKPNIPSPATPIPITLPPANDISNALDKLVRAACAVRTFALVAIRIPINPADADKTAPVINASMIYGDDLGSFHDKKPNNIEAITINIASTLYSAFKNDIAPLAI